MFIKDEIQTKKGAKVIIDTLRALGVDTIFGYPGGIVLDLYDELYRQSEIKHVLVRHEQSAVHAAEGYARVTGKCGVALVTSGPGATNTVSGIVNAYLDGFPVVVLTGQVFKNLIGEDAFQEANICDITKSCTKKVFQVTDARELQSTLKEAFAVAMSGKKGPVVVDLSKNVFGEFVEYKADNLSFNSESLECSKQDIERVFNRIKNSKRPVIVSGGGVTHSGAEEELFALSNSLNIPVVATMMGVGTFPQNSQNYFGMIGIFGDKAANQILKDSDLIISLGARFNDRITCMFKDCNLAEKFIQVDINPLEIGRVIDGVDSICADVSDFLSTLNKMPKSVDFSPWLEKAQGLRSLNTPNKKISNMLHSFEVIQHIEKFTKDKDIIFTSEVGQHMLWAVQNLSLNKERKILLSGGSGTMGFGFPAGIGAAIAKPDKTIVCISGDGSFQMNLEELAVCKDYNLNVKIMILNNGYLGMVRQLQEKSFGGRYCETKISNPDFLKLAESYGIGSRRVASIDEIEEALTCAFSTEGPFVVDFVVEPMELL